MYLRLLLMRAVACSVVAVAVAAAFAAMRTAPFPHGGVLSVAVCVRLAFAVVLTAVTVAFAMMMRMPFAMLFAVVLTTVTFAVAFAVAMLTFARAVRVGTAMAAFGVLMSLAVMRAVCFRRIVKRTGEMLCDSLVRRALDAGVDADASISERFDRARADTAADERIDFVFLQKSSECAVTAALRADDLRFLYGVLLDVVEFECLRVAEVLEHRAVFIFIGDCDSHRSFSFLSRGRKAIVVTRFCTRAAFAARCGHVAELVEAAFDDERSTVHEALGDFFACCGIDFGDRRARDRHAFGAFLLLEPIVVDAAYALVLFEEQGDGLAAGKARRREALVGGTHADPSPPCRSWHSPRLL